MMSAPRDAQIVSLDPEKLLAPPPGWITVEVAFCGVCGTDLHIYSGDYLGGYPVVPGHEFSGTVVACGEGSEKFKRGDRVAVEPNLSCGVCEACLHNRQHFCSQWQAIGVTLSGAMATHVQVPQSAAFSIGDLSLQAAAWMEPLSCVLHGVERLGAVLGRRLLLIGAGPIGMLLYRTLRAAGASCIDVVERNTYRASFALDHGIPQVFNDLLEVKRTDYDIVVDATGNVKVLELILGYLRPAGTALFFGVPAQHDKMAIKPFSIFRNELTIIGSYTSLRNSQQAISLMANGNIITDDLVTHLVPLDELPSIFEYLNSAGSQAMKVMIDSNQIRS
jgi:2-desacetyl-2-hydroxyethyl bacteriochlorophyllide A dehydrogenase